MSSGQSVSWGQLPESAGTGNRRVTPNPTPATIEVGKHTMELKMDEKVEEALARIAATYRKAGASENLAEVEIGRAVVVLLQERETVSAADLIQHFTDKIGQSKSARGEIKADLDLQRILWEAAIKALPPLSGD